MSESDDCEKRLRAAEPFLREQRLLAFGAAAFFDVGERDCKEHEQRRPCREGVVLLVGGDGEEEQREPGEE